MFSMTSQALGCLEQGAGWRLGVGPGVVVADEGEDGSISTTTAKDDIDVLFLDHKG